MPWFVYGTGGSRILFHPSRPLWMKTNGTALEIGLRLMEGPGEARVAEDLAGTRGISLERALGDVLQVKETLTGLGFLGAENLAPRERLPSARSLFLHLTGRCNLACVHCYVGASPDSRRPDLSTEAVQGLLDQLKAAGGRLVTLGGGEPLLHPGLRTILGHATPELEIRLLTNGTLIDRRWAGLLAEHGVSVQVSLESASPERHDAIRGKGSFERTLRGIDHLREAGLSDRVTLAATAMALNIEGLPDLAALAERLGIPLVRLLPLRRKGTALRRWEEIGGPLTRERVERLYDDTLRQGRRPGHGPEIHCGLSGFMLALPEGTEDAIWCPIGRRLLVDTEGEAYPCPLLMQPEFRIGNALTQSLASLFQSAAMGAVCRALTERRERIAGCVSCTWKNLCQSGCMGLAMEHRGTIWDTDDFCAYRKRLYREAFDRILSLPDHGQRQPRGVPRPLTP